MPLARTFRSNSVLRLLLGWAVFLALLGLYWFQLLSFHDRQLAGTEQGAMLRADQAAHALAMQGHSKLLKIEFFLDHLAEHWMEHDPEVFDKLIELGQKGIFKGSLNRIVVAGADGLVQYSNHNPPDAPLIGRSIADKAYFRQHQAAPEGLIISQPERDQRSGAWSVPFSYSFFDGEQLAGVITAYVSPSHLADGFIRIYPEKPNVVLMTLNDGRYLTRSQELDRHLGQSVPQHREFIQHTDREQGRYAATAPIDGVARYYAWHRVPDYPVVLSLGLSKEQALATVQGAIKRSRLQNLFTCFFLLVAAVWISRYSRLRAREHKLMLQTDERMRMLLERFPTGVLLEDERNTVVAANPILCSLLTLTSKPGALHGLPHAEFLHLLKDEHAAQLALPEDDLASGYRTELEEAAGRILEIEWLPIRHDQRNLGHAWFIKDVSAQRRKEQQLQELANVDPLTGLLNRRSFMSLLADSLRNSHPHRPGALFILDIDHFKAVNDTWGHPAGDVVLQNVAQIIQGSLRKGDYTGRLGGEEFAVLLPTATADEAQMLAERIRIQLQEATTETPEATITVTISIGIALLHNHDLQSVQDAADKALYQAKHNGRNQVCLAQSL